MTFRIGENVGPYRITDRLGQGGMATVFRAYHANLDRYVAIKVLHAVYKDDSSFIARFRREAQIVAKLEHPNIVPVYDYSEHNGEPYLVMRFIEGETLKARLSRQPLTLEETLSTMTAVSQALTYAHERGVLHRDIKPSNILLEKNVDPFLADFGLARMTSAGESTLSQDMMLGTPQYMSPEQAQGVGNLDAGTDIYSLGVVLYEVVVGRVPYNADTPYAIVHDQIYAPLPLPSSVNPQVPRAVEQVLLKALAKERTDRYTSAVEMIAAFHRSVKDSNLTQLSPSSYRPPDITLDIPASPVNTPYGFGTPAVPSVLAPGAVIPASGDAGLTARRSQQKRRAALWMLGGFAGLIATCLIGMALTASAFGDPGIRANLFVTRTATKPKPSPSVLATAALTGVAQLLSPETPNSTLDGTAPAMLTATMTVTATPFADFNILTLPNPDQYVAQNPNDALGHFALAVSYVRQAKALKAQSEFSEGIRLARSNAPLLLDVARQISHGSDQLNSVAALVYAYAYSAGAASDTTLRGEAGQYIYEFMRDPRKRDLATVRRIAEIAAVDQSAALAALTALGFSALNVPDSEQAAITGAMTLNAKNAEVRLVNGILLLGQNNPGAATAQLNAVIAAADAPAWSVSVAKQIVATIPTPTP